jgi:hypothetical protein
MDPHAQAGLPGMIRHFGIPLELVAILGPALALVFVALALSSCTAVQADSAEVVASNTSGKPVSERQGVTSHPPKLADRPETPPTPGLRSSRTASTACPTGSRAGRLSRAIRRRSRLLDDGASSLGVMVHDLPASTAQVGCPG